MSNFPSSLDSFTNPAGTTLLSDASALHNVQHSNANDAIRALEQKVGIGAGTPDSGKVFVGSGAGTSSWGTSVSGLLVGTSQITGGTITTASITSSTITSSTVNSSSFGTPTIIGGTIGVSGTTSPVVFGGAFFPAVVTLLDAPGGTITPNGPSGCIFSIVLGTTAGNRTIGTPTNLSIDGEPLIFRIKQNAAVTGTLVYAPIYKFSGGTAGTFTLGTVASAWNYYGHRYNAVGTTIDEQSKLLNIS